MTIKTFVLIYTVYSVTASVEFGALGECERAGKKLQEQWASARHVCVEKTTIPQRN